MSDKTLARTVDGKHVTVFKPEEAKTEIAKAEAMIEYAQRVKDWPALESAVEHKLEEIREFVDWWLDAVTVNHGAGRGKKSAVRGSFSMPDAEKKTGISHQQVSRWRKRLNDEEGFKRKLYGKAYTEAFGKAENYKANSDSDDEWYTPEEYIEAARAVMGGIDLDPASNPEANDTVKAEQYFTPQDNGLAQEWHGRVWLNPPYSRDLMPAFVNKLVSEYQAGRVDQAIMVSHNNTDTAWFYAAAGAACAVCFPSRRIRFYRGDDVAAPVNGQVFMYFGEDAAPFAGVFERHGSVFVPFRSAA